MDCKYFIFIIKKGQKEWNGPWSDGSKEMKMLSSDDKERLGITVNEDGEFWMSYQDFTSLFARLELCNTTAQSLDEERRKGHFWDTISYNGSWVKGKSAGGCTNHPNTYDTNPQFVVTLTNKDESYDQGRCKLLVSLLQKYGRHAKNGTGNFFIGFAIYSIQENLVSQVPLKNDVLRFCRQVERSTIINSRGVTARFKLPPGNYLIIPSTYEPNQETDFLLRICFESDDIGENNEIICFKEMNDNIKDNGKFVEVRRT